MERTASRDLVAVQRRVEQWRAGHGGRGSRIPERLWTEAVEVARVAGVYPTARALRFNYERLRERATRSEETSAVERCSAPAGFVALEVGQPCREGKTVLDLVGRGGEQMRIDITGRSSVDVVALALMCWIRQS